MANLALGKRPLEKMLYFTEVVEQFKAPWGSWGVPIPYRDGYVMPLGWEDELTARGVHYEVIDYEVIDFEEEGSPFGTEQPTNETSKGPLVLVSNGVFSRIVDARVPPALGVEGLAEDMALLLSNITTEKGNMVGVFGEWGRGKSYLINQILKQKAIDQNFIIVEYHAWKYQDTPASWAYLYEEIVKKFFGTPDPSKFKAKANELCKVFLLNVSIHGRYPLVFLFLAIVGFFGMLLLERPAQLVRDVLWWLTLGGSATVFGAVAATYLRYKKTASDLFSKYLSRPRFNDFMGAQAEIQKELSALLKHWIPISDEQDKMEVPDYKRILLVIEDIDRCSEDKIIQLVDSLRVMLDDAIISKRVVVLAAVDERILERAINLKYHGILSKDPRLLVEKEEKQKLHEISTRIIHEYMDKLFIAGIKLNSLGPDYRLKYYDKLTEGVVVSGKAPLQSSSVPLESEPKANIHSESEESVPSITHVPITKDSVDEEKEVEVYGLTYEEDDILRQCVRGFHGSTPRQIRIFYYRYLLGRTLLKRRGVNKMKDLSMFATLLVQGKNPVNLIAEGTTSDKEEIQDIPIPEVRECLEMVLTY